MRIVLALGVSIILLSACGPSDRSAEETARAYVDHVAAGDIEQARALLSPSERADAWPSVMMQCAAPSGMKHAQLIDTSDGGQAVLFSNDAHGPSGEGMISYAVRVERDAGAWYVTLDRCA